MSVCVCTCTYMKWSEVQVTQSCLPLCDPMDYTVRGTLQARTLEWVAFSRGSSQPRDRTQVSRIAGRFFPSWASREAQEYGSGQPIPSPADLPDPEIELGSPALQVDSLPTQLSGKLLMCIHMHMQIYSHMCVYINMYVYKCSVHIYNWPLICGYLSICCFLLVHTFKNTFSSESLSVLQIVLHCSRVCLGLGWSILVLPPESLRHQVATWNRGEGRCRSSVQDACTPRMESFKCGSKVGTERLKSGSGLRQRFPTWLYIESPGRMAQSAAACCSPAPPPRPPHSPDSEPAGPRCTRKSCSSPWYLRWFLCTCLEMSV